MGKKAPSPLVRAQAVALHDSGLNQVQIAQQLKVSRCFVQNAIKKFGHRHHHNDAKRLGRPKKTLVAAFAL